MARAAAKPTRWISEEACLAELERLNDLSEATAHEYVSTAVAAAHAKATHKALRGKAILMAKVTVSDGGRGAKSHAEAETIAESDEDVAVAYMELLAAEAKVDSTKELLRTIRENQADLRTAVASNRAMFAGPGYQR